MLLTCVFLFLLCIQGQVAGWCKTVEDTELMMAFLVRLQRYFDDQNTTNTQMYLRSTRVPGKSWGDLWSMWAENSIRKVHRHGDRAAEISELLWSNDPIELSRRSQMYGFGYLTDVGKFRSFTLGQFFRRRYDQLLSSCYNPSDIFVRSTDFNRTQMTVQIAVTAAYSSELLYSDDMELVPVEMTVVPLTDDPNFSILSCREVGSHYSKLTNEDKFPEDLQIYNELMDLLSKDLSFNLQKNPVTLFGKLNNFATQESLGMPISDLNRRLLPTVRQGAGIAAKYVFGNQTLLPLQSGVLLKEFFDSADKIISGAKIPRVRVLSAHDLNVYSFVAATRALPRQGAPRYCSVYSLELRRCRKTGKYFVVPVYVKTPEEPEAYLDIEDCGVLCDYEKFRKLTAKNVITEDQFRTRCKRSEEDEDKN